MDGADLATRESVTVARLGIPCLSWGCPGLPTWSLSSAPHQKGGDGFLPVFEKGAKGPAHGGVVAADGGTGGDAVAADGGGGAALRRRCGRSRRRSCPQRPRDTPHAPAQHAVDAPLGPA